MQIDPTPNYKDLKDEGAVSSQGSSELDKIAEEHSEESGNDYSDDDADNTGLLSYTPTSATTTTKKYHDEMVNNKTDVLGQTTNKEEMLGENGSDYSFGKIIHHIMEKVLNQKDVPQPAPVVNVYQTVGHYPAPAVHHTAVQGLASAAACPGTVTSFE